MKTMLTIEEQIANWMATDARIKEAAGRTDDELPKPVSGKCGCEYLTTQQQKRRDGIRKTRPVSGRIGDKVDVRLTRAELHQLAGTADDLIAAWQASLRAGNKVPLPPVLEGFPRLLRKKVIRQGGSDYVMVKLPKKQAYAAGGMLLTFAGFLPKDALDPAGWKWLVAGAAKLLHAGKSRPGRRRAKPDAEVSTVELWRRAKRAETRTASSILLGKEFQN